MVLGAAAGAAGTTALNAVTYLDMAVRGRPASTTPEKSVEKLSDLAGVDIPGDEQKRQHRLQGLGPLLGLGTGVAVGAVYGVLAQVPGLRALPGTLLAGGVAMAGANAPMVGLGLTDPRSWSPAAWASDVVPHVAYGMTTARVLDALT